MVARMKKSALAIMLTALPLAAVALHGEPLPVGRWTVEIGADGVARYTDPYRRSDSLTVGQVRFESGGSLIVGNEIPNAGARAASAPTPSARAPTAGRRAAKRSSSTWSAIATAPIATASGTAHSHERSNDEISQ
jgi:hypothetical protein